METQPKIKIELSVTDRLIEISGWLALSVLWILTLYHYKNLPETIPTHFNAAGAVDNFGDKSTIFLLPVIGTVLFIGMTILNRYPHVFNYPVKINVDNAVRQYTMATRLIRVLKISIVLVFSMITWMTSVVAYNEMRNPVVWFLPVLLAIIFIPLGIYIVKAFRLK